MSDFDPSEQVDTSEAAARSWIAKRLTASQVDLLASINEGARKPDGRQSRAIVALLAYCVIVRSPATSWDYWTTTRGAWVLMRIRRSGRLA